ncbi:surfactin family lipopeptide synthetase A [Pedobacter cryoconitis]|uniref:Surfactin family lipopeptide synthetase A n=1 Tax=Pedobacter cryoconitis TaxID=188932 RepID=A0A7W8YQ35_9SPHI|nr:non-ribosomal peptide synthetase [Pedobacter cryoconitis]MBB5619455.1 surfactin family lipopeptide synthetase A [Pedobacter cryoconitis]
MKLSFNTFAMHPAQQDIFIDQLINIDSPHYNINNYFKITGPLDIDKFISAIVSSPAVFDVFKMAIATDDFNPGYQLAGQERQLSVQLIDFTGYDHPVEMILQWIENQTDRPIVLEKSKIPVEQYILKAAEDEHYYYFKFHHLLFDGYSVRVWTNYISRKYKSLLNNEQEVFVSPSYLQEVEKAVANYGSDAYQASAAYWKAKIKAKPASILQPAYEVLNAPGKESSYYTRPLEKGEQIQLAQAAITSQARLQHLTIAAMVIYLARTYGQEHSLFGTAAHKRNQKHQREILGMFSGIAPFKGSYEPEAKLIDFIKAIVRSQKEDYQHLDYTAGDLSRYFKHDPLTGPFFDFVINHIVFDMSFNLGTGIQTAHGVEFSRYQQIPLEIMWLDYGEDQPLQLVIGFRYEYFKEAEIAQFAEALLAILKQFTHALQFNVENIQVNTTAGIPAFITKNKNLVPVVLTAEESAKLKSFNATEMAYPEDKNLVELFIAQTNLLPDSIAVITQDQHLTYRELDQKSNHLGNYLRSAGVREDMLVPICMERSAEMIIGILGILKAGGAYVPVDPEYPQERVDFILADTGAAIVVSSSAQQTLFNHHTGIRVILMDTDWDKIAQEPASVVMNELRAAHLCYVIYTSGSTGQPKGVLIEHKSVHNMVFGWQKKLTLTNADRVLLFSNYTFDAAVEQLFMALLNGAGLVIITREVQMNVDAVLSVMNAEKVTYMLATPGFLRNIPADRVPSSLRHITAGGERCGIALAQNWTAYAELEFHNAYGPTECTVFATTYQFERGWNEADYLPIGKPAGNVQLYLLDPEGNLLPEGVTGEICIGGAGVARGYLNREELTARQFIPDTFGNTTGGRLYKTGDIGRWLPDGNMEFTGRIDDQVKVRGYRIEPGEIESAVQQSGMVSQAVVIAVEESGSNQLVCYVIPEKFFDKQGLISYLETRLPEYMVPRIYVEMAVFPLTAHGKLDKKALPSADIKGRLSRDYVAAGNELEARLVSIWEELLQASPIGTHDSFFELGGHSLLAMRISGYIQQELGVNVPVKSIFQCENIKALAAYITEHTGSSQGHLAIPVNKKNTAIPLSYGQESLWRIDQLNGSKQYHMPMYFRLSGTIRTDALEHAINEVVNRHEILRTVIHQDADGQPFQFVLERDTWSLNRIKHVRGEESGLDDLLTTLSSAAYDLRTDHMLRAHLIRISEQEQILVIILHHIAADGWSVSVLIRELVSLYQLNITGLTAPLAALGLQYRDYSIWQRSQEESHWSDGIAYWKKQLEGTSQLELPADYPRPVIQSTRGAMAIFPLGAKLSAGLQLLSRQHGATLHMVMLSAFKILLHRYSGQDDICVGSVIAGRTRQELEGLIGFFANTLALRSNLGGNPSFEDFLQQVKETTLNAYEHQDIPFERVVEAVGQERDKSRNPLYQVIFTVQNIPEVPEFRLGETVFTQQKTGRTTSQFDLNVSVTEAEAGIEISVEYCTDLFKGETIDRIFGNYQELLQSILYTPSQKIDQLPMLRRPEQQELLFDFNNTSVAYPHEQTLVDFFSRQVVQTPDAIALVYEDQQLTYKELDEKSNQLGHYLRSAGVREDMLVPVCITRSITMMIGILGILKAGGAYVPVDPEYPQERIHYILSDTNAGIVVSSEAHKSLLNGGSANLRIISLDGLELELIAQEAKLAVPTILRPDHLCYVMYTSGSTGQPKGVLVTHSNVTSLISGANYIRLSSRDALLSAGSPSFDATTFEYWSMLLNGGRLILCPVSSLLDNRLFKEILQVNKITVMWFTAGWFNQLVDVDIDLFESLSTVMVGGEKLSVAHINRFRAFYPDKTIINGYGPTENTTFSICYPVQELESSGNIPLGRPLNNRQAYVLDNFEQPVPIGVAGEIYVGGAGVARGYLNAEELTAARFINDPFVNGNRLYKTGDIGRWLSNGNLEFIGRVDDQVKIRGYRVGLGEIENAVQQSGFVGQCVILAPADESGQKRLVAYIIAHENGFDQDALVAYLEAHLPDYMIPHVFIELEVFPLTANGKLDKKALPDANNRKPVNMDTADSLTETEQKVKEIWALSLEVEELGIHDDFFKLGGDSIVAIGVISRLRKAFNDTIRLYDLYECSTISRLSALIDSGHAVVAEDKGHTIREAVIAELESLRSRLLPDFEDEAEIADVYPMSDIQSGMVYASQLNPEQAIYHDQLAFKMPLSLNRTVFEQALKLLVAKHSILRTRFDLDIHTDDVQVVYKQGDAELVFRDIRSATGNGSRAYLADYLAEERTIPFVVHQGKLWRISLLQTLKDYILVFQFHHALFDGWSVASFTTELNNLYLAILGNGEQVQITPLKASYRDFVIESMAEKRNQDNRKFWTESLTGYKRLDIFTENVADDNWAKAYDFSYLQRLKDKTKADGLSLKGMFLGAYQYMLSMLTAEQEVTLGVVTNGRPLTEDGDKVLGCFLNTVPFRFVGGNTAELSWKAYFERIEQQLTSLKERDRMPLMEIAKLTGEQSSSDNPFFDTIFNYINFHVYDQMDAEEGLFAKQGHVQLEEEDDQNASGGYEATNTYLDCSISVTGDVLVVSYHRTRGLKSDKTLADIHAYFDTVLEAYLEHYTKRIADVPVLPAQELELLHTFNSTKAAYPEEQTLVDLFSTQAAQHPDAVALIDQDQHLTYDELDLQSNQLAHYLRSAGVKEDTLVPICIGRSMDMIIGILGILKAGGAYVPIDPEYPQERINYMLSDTGARIVVSNAQYRELLEAQGIVVVSLDEEMGLIQQESAAAVITDLQPSHLCYVIYTSGSTGQPKGVLIEHKGVVNLICDRRQVLNLTDSDRILLFSNYTFDPFAEQLFTALLSDAELVIIPKEVQLDSSRLMEVMTAEKITYLDVTPGFLNGLVQEEELKDLKRIIAGGERCATALAQRWASDTADFYNAYGPTECTITATVYPYDKNRKNGEYLSIGKPVGNVQIHILDNGGNLLPLGVPGEICIAGAGVARGYLNRADLTAARFIPNPFGVGRLYKTGDTGRWLPDGNIEFIGRIDDQVKVRGYRIELGEIESAIQQSGLVSQSIVLAQTDNSGNNQLICYVVSSGVFVKENLVAYLEMQLPEYMVPRVFVEMESVPLTSHGKLDKKALPVADTKGQLSENYVPAASELESALVGIWEELLQVSPIGIHDSFFELGGHSLLAMRVNSSIQKELKVNVPVKSIFQCKSIAKLAEYIEELQDKTVRLGVNVISL